LQYLLTAQAGQYTDNTTPPSAGFCFVGLAPGSSWLVVDLVFVLSSFFPPDHLLMSRLFKLLPELVFNFLLPWLAYRWALPQWGETTALMVSSLPPIVWSGVELLRFRRVDALSLLVVGGIALSLLVMLLGGSPRVLLMRESLLSGLFGVVFLLSLLAARPLVYHLALATVARESVDGQARFIRRWQEPAFRRGIRQMTLLWGAGLTLETTIRCCMIWQLPVETFLLLSPFVSYGIMGLLVGLTWLGRRQLRSSPPAWQS